MQLRHKITGALCAIGLLAGGVLALAAPAAAATLAPASVTGHAVKPDPNATPAPDSKNTTAVPMRPAPCTLTNSCPRPNAALQLCSAKAAAAGLIAGAASLASGPGAIYVGVVSYAGTLYTCYYFKW